MGITKHLWGLSSSIGERGCPPPLFQSCRYPLVVLLPLCCHCHFCLRCGAGKNNRACLPLCLILTKPLPLLLLKAAACLGGSFSLYSGCLSRFCASFASGWGYWQGEVGLTGGLVKLGSFLPIHCYHPLLSPQVAAPGTPSRLRCFQGDKVQ